MTYIYRQKISKYLKSDAKNFLLRATQADTTDFDRYRELYSVGADIEPPDTAFHAQVRIHLFNRMMIYERDIAGVRAKRSRVRAGNDGFDHITAHLLLSGDFVGLPIGIEHRLQAGEIMLIDAL